MLEGRKVCTFFRLYCLYVRNRDEELLLQSRGVIEGYTNVKKSIVPLAGEEGSLGIREIKTGLCRSGPAWRIWWVIRSLRQLIMNARYELRAGT